jgi:hypothetical protein
MNLGRGTFSLITLPNGEVLAAGGWPDLQTSFGLSSAEVYSPTSGTWSLVGALSAGRAGYATELPNGDVLFPGGITCCGYGSIQTADRYSRATRKWGSAGSMTVPRSQTIPVTLHNGQVLVAGGDESGIYNGTATAELFNPASGIWASTGSMSTPRILSGEQVLSDGRVLVASGYDDNTGQYLPSAEVYTPTTGVWTLTPPVPVAACAPRSVRLANGSVLLLGGLGPTGPLAEVELFRPWHLAASGRILSHLFRPWEHPLSGIVRAISKF